MRAVRAPQQSDNDEVSSAQSAIGRMECCTAELGTNHSESRLFDHQKRGPKLPKTKNWNQALVTSRLGRRLGRDGYEQGSSELITVHVARHVLEV